MLYMRCTEATLFIRQSEDWAIRNRQKWLQFWKRVNMQSFLHFIHETDQSAFVTVSTVSEVIGEWNKHKKKEPFEKKAE